MCRARRRKTAKSVRGWVPRKPVSLRPVNMRGHRAKGMRAPENTNQFLMTEKYRLHALRSDSVDSSTDSDEHELTDMDTYLGAWEDAHGALLDPEIQEKERDGSRVSGPQRSSVGVNGLTLRGDSLTPRRDKRTLRGDRGTLRGDSLTPRRDKRTLRGDSLTPRRDKRTLRGDRGTLRGDSLTLRGDSLTPRRDKRTLRRDRGTLREDRGTFREDGLTLRGDRGTFREDSLTQREDGLTQRGDRGTLKGDRRTLLFQNTDEDSVQYFPSEDDLNLSDDFMNQDFTEFCHMVTS